MALRYFPNTDHSSRPLLTVEEAYEDLIATLDTIIDRYPPSREDRNLHKLCGFYYGPTSVSLLFFALSKIFPQLLLHGNPLTYWATKYFELSDLRRQGEPDWDHCGLADEYLCSLALRTVFTKSEDDAHRLCRFIPIFTHPQSPPRSYEWLYGLSGLLYLLRFCQANLAGPPSCLRESIEKVSKCILDNSDKWAWHEKPYYGAVHGDIGIITQLVLSNVSLPNLNKQLSHRLSSLLRRQLASGNFPTYPTSSRDLLVQFCHGAPGVLVSFHSLRSHFPNLQSEISEAVERGERCVLERGLLRKTPCLCHGVYGNALAMNQEDMMKMLRVVYARDIEWAESKENEDEKFGLFTGLAGRAWAMAMAATGKHGIVLGYNDV